MKALYIAIVTLLVVIASKTLAQDIACTACHSNVDAGRIHGAAEVACKACHGDGTEHIPQPSTGILRFDDEPVAERNAACTGCHSDVHSSGQSAHEQAGLACSDCHSVHKDATEAADRRFPAGFDRLDDVSATCFGCHEDVFAAFSGVERHRLEKGAVACTSCHDPHGEARSAELGGFAHSSGDPACADCHAAQDGPFVYEHAASRIDGCIACHEPHGNPNRFLLARQQVGELCYSCHAAVPQFHLGFSPQGPPRFGLDSVCTNCHVTIHGSNFDRNFLK